MKLTTGMDLEGTMASATGTTMPRFHAVWHDVPAQEKAGMEEYRGGVTRGLFDDTNQVTMLTGPTSGPGQAAERIIDHISIMNRSTATEIFELQTDDGTARSWVFITLTAGQSGHYNNGAGWQTVGP